LFEVKEKVVLILKFLMEARNNFAECLTPCDATAMFRIADERTERLFPFALDGNYGEV